MSRQALNSAERAGENDPVAAYMVQVSLLKAWFSNGDDASRGATAARRRSASRDVMYGAALTFTYTGDDKTAHTLSADLARRFPADTMVQFDYLPTLRAKLLLNQGKA